MILIIQPDGSAKERNPFGELKTCDCKTDEDIAKCDGGCSATDYTIKWQEAENRLRSFEVSNYQIVKQLISADELTFKYVENKLMPGTLVEATEITPGVVRINKVIN